MVKTFHDTSLGRRAFVTGAAATVASLYGGRALADGAPAPAVSLVATPPDGFVPMNAPGRVVKVSSSNTLQPNGLWPKQEAATRMLERGMTELTGASDLGAAFAKFVHPKDKVAIKPNGLAGKDGCTMASNKELVLGIVRGIVAAGVPASSIVIYEQWDNFMAGTRITDPHMVLDPEFPAGVTAVCHRNKDAAMEHIDVEEKHTRFVRAFTDATCVINVGLIKDHAICGYTGCLKNITHGSITNPQDFHAHTASPQIAKLYAQDVARSRVRLHITDAYKLIYDGGPTDQIKMRRIPHEALYVSTDPVATDVIGCAIVEQHRKDAKLPTLKDSGRDPSYIQVAGDLGLGIFDRNMIRLREVTA